MQGDESPRVPKPHEWRLLLSMVIDLVSSEDEDGAPAPPSAATPKRQRETTAIAPNSSCKKVLFGPPFQTLSGGDSADGEQSRRQDASASGSADHFDDGIDELLLQIPMPATRATPADPAATQPAATAVATTFTVTRPAAATPAAVTPASTTPAAATPAAATLLACMALGDTRAESCGEATMCT